MIGKCKFVLLFCLGLVLMACKKDDKDKLDISGSYTKTYVAATYEFQVKLSFLANGTFVWEPIGEVEGHQASNASYELLSTNHLRIFNDADCGSDAVYSYSLLNNKLTLTHTTDDCPPRIGGLEGEWQKQ